MKSSLLKDFKEFAVKGNMIEIAIGVVIGAAFNKVIDVIVKQIILPPLSLLTDGLNWENKKIILRQAVEGNGAIQIEEVAIGYGQLIGAGLDFLIIGFTVFIIVKLMNRLRKKADDPKNKEVVTPKNIELLHRMTELMEKQVAMMEKSELRK